MGALLSSGAVQSSRVLLKLRFSDLTVVLSTCSGGAGGRWRRGGERERAREGRAQGGRTRGNQV